MYLDASMLALSSYLSLASANIFFSKGDKSEERNCSSSEVEVDADFIGTNADTCVFNDDAPFEHVATFSSKTVCIVFPHHSRKEATKALREYPCFISSKEECPKLCTPYTEFGSVAAFYVPIPVRDAKGVFSHDGNTRSHKEIKQAIECTTSYADFDGMIPFLYNVDLYMAIKSCKFDVSFVTYFINCFHKYLIARLDTTKHFCSSNGCVMDKESNCEVDLLCACCHGGCHFADPCCIFNEIIGNTKITRFVIEFIDRLLHQIKCSCDRACEKRTNCKEFTTYDSYKIVLTHALEVVRQLLLNAHQARKNFLSGKLITVFATVPYVQSTTTAPSSTINARAMFVIDTASVNLDKLVDF